jgi:CRP/FNR family transcriptional regulator
VDPEQGAGAPGRFALHRPERLQSLVRGEEKVTALMRGARVERSAGRALTEGGSDHPYVYRLVRGWAGRSRMLPDGRNQFILIFLPNDLFGIKSMFVNRQVDSIRAISDIVVERVHYTALHEVYVRDSDVASRCTWQVIEEERRLHSWVVGLGQGSADERLALLLLDFKGRLTSSGALREPALEYEMPLTQTQLGDHLGITAVHMNRVLKEFRDSGIVTVRSGRVQIQDLDSLVKRAAALLDVYERSQRAYVGDSPPAAGSPR